MSDDLTTMPPPRHVLAIEISQYERNIIELEKKGFTKEQTSTLWIEIATRKEAFRILTGEGYSNIDALDAPRIQKYALNKVYHALNGITWGSNRGWNGQIKTLLKPEILPLEAEASFYSGIILSKMAVGNIVNTNVATVSLQGYGCDGDFPSKFIGDLEACKYLNLNLNLIKGKISSEICTLDNLHTIDISSNQLTGELDERTFENFQKLQVLNLSHNQLTGSIPDVFDRMKRLTSLNLGSNLLLGLLPKSMSCLVDLEVLHLHKNQLTGAIPTTFSKLVNLKSVNLSQNAFTSGLNSFNHCTKLKRLILNHNSIDDTLHNSISQLQSLELLYVQNNKIRGSICEEFYQLTMLKHINLTNNELNGVIHHNIDKLSLLQTLLVHKNDICGPIPSSISNLKNLRDLKIIEAYPSEFTAPVRQFSKKVFDSIYSIGPNALRINSVIYDRNHVYGDNVDDDKHIFIDYRKNRSTKKTSTKDSSSDKITSAVIDIQR